MIIRYTFFMPEFKNMRPLRMINSSGKEILVNANFKRKQPFFFKAVPSFFYILIITIGTIIKTLSELYNNQQNKLIAETHRASTELNYLRKQTNPHFLFKIWNN